MGHYVYKYVLDGEIIYIGKNDTNLHDRIRSHGKSGDNITPEGWNDIKKAEIYFIKLANAVMSDVVEKELIRRYKPKYNKDGVKSQWQGIPFIEPEWKKYVPEPPKQQKRALKREPISAKYLQSIRDALKRNEMSAPFLKELLALTEQRKGVLPYSLLQKLFLQRDAAGTSIVFHLEEYEGLPWAEDSSPENMHGLLDRTVIEVCNIRGSLITFSGMCNVGSLKTEESETPVIFVSSSRSYAEFKEWLTSALCAIDKMSVYANGVLSLKASEERSAVPHPCVSCGKACAYREYIQN